MCILKLSFGITYRKFAVITITDSELFTILLSPRVTFDPGLSYRPFQIVS